MSASLKQLGLDAVAVDKLAPKAPKAFVTKIDLSLPSNQLLLLSWIRNPRVKAVFLAPPCGTASRAGNIQCADDPFLPQPLRSKEFPDGLPGLTGTDLLRVDQSNILYDFSATVFDLCCELIKLCLCENPRGSLSWESKAWRESVSMHIKIAYSAIRRVHTDPADRNGQSSRPILLKFLR